MSPRRIVDRRQAFEHLLICRRTDHGAIGIAIGQRRAAPIVDHRPDGRAVKLLQRAELPRAGALAIERRRVDDEHILEQSAQPGFPARGAVRLLKERFDRRDARGRIARNCRDDWIAARWSIEAADRDVGRDPRQTA